jgi:hypothetical protein
MQTTASTATDGAGRTVADETDATIRRSIQTLIRVRDADRDDIAAQLGVHRSTFYRRLGGHGAPFTAGEVAVLAAFFGVPVADLFEGLTAIAVPLRRTGTDDQITPARSIAPGTEVNTVKKLRRRLSVVRATSTSADPTSVPVAAFVQVTALHA